MSRLVTALAAIALGAGCGGSSGSGSGPGPGPSSPVPTAGLDQRPANLTCLAPALPIAGADIRLTRVFENLSFTQPLGMLQAPGDAGRWYVLEKTGRVIVFANDPTVTTQDVFIDLNAIAPGVNSGGEGGLLGMAFHPDFATNGEVFLSWTTGTPMVSVIARFTSPDGGATLPTGSMQTILTLEQPFENHNGGGIAFGSDGMLYIGFGDGGGANDPFGWGQETRNLMGSMLRLDVDAGSPYAIPADNPFAGNATCPSDPDVLVNACPEIFAWGLRNPWRWSFDTQTDMLWLADVGQGSQEEIDIIVSGGNYGWNCREGTENFGGATASCASGPVLTDPIHTYTHSLGNSVTGGYVYRGASIPALVGDYLFGDYGSGRIWRLTADASGGYADEELLDTSLSISSFGQGADGELYVLHLPAGAIFRIDADAAPDPGSAVPALLSATGCVDPSDPTQPASGLIPYEPAAAFWSDGAEKSRWLAVPDGTTVAVDGSGDFALPERSVLMKHFRLNGRLIETRLLMHHPGGTWAGYTFAWDASETDATMVVGGRVDSIDGQSWTFPSSAQCDACHTSAAGSSLGLETAQLNTDLTYPATGRTANQLLSLNSINLFTATIGDPSVLPTLADPYDVSADLGERARAYLHTNCAQCHRPSGPTPSDLDLRYSTLLDATMACDVSPQAGDLGLGSNARIIAPGDAAASVLVARMNRRDSDAMPPVASSVVDAAGVQLITNWIDSLAGCIS